MNVIVCEKCGKASWSDDLCSNCLDALQEVEWSALILSLSSDYANIVANVRSRYPDWDLLDSGWGL